MRPQISCSSADLSMRALDGSLQRPARPGLWLAFGPHQAGRGAPALLVGPVRVRLGATPPAFRPQARSEGEARATSSSSLGKARKGPSHAAVRGAWEAPGRGEHPEPRRSPSAPCSRALSGGRVCRGGGGPRLAPRHHALDPTQWLPPGTARAPSRLQPRGVGSLGRVCIPGRPHCSARGGRLPLPPPASPSLPACLPPSPLPSCPLVPNTLRELSRDAFPLGRRPAPHPARPRASGVRC